MLCDSLGNCLANYVPDYVLFDLETTGISCNYDEILEISAVKVRGGIVAAEYSTLVNPGRPIPYQASMVNHITDDMVSDCPALPDVLPSFLEFIGEDVLVGHNIAAFDMKFLWRDCRKYLGKIPGNDYVDTLRFARAQLAGMPNYRLTTLAEHYGLSTCGAHRALNDCRMNQQVFELLAREQPVPQEPVGICPRCGAPLKKRRGKFGEFLGCTGYPACRYTADLKYGI